MFATMLNWRLNNRKKLDSGSDNRRCDWSLDVSTARADETPIALSSAMLSIGGSKLGRS